MLDENRRLFDEENSKFQLMLKDFYRKLNNSEFDVKELKRFGKQYGYDLQNIENKISENVNLQKQLKRQQ